MKKTRQDNERMLKILDHATETVILPAQEIIKKDLEHMYENYIKEQELIAGPARMKFFYRGPGCLQGSAGAD